MPRSVQIVPFYAQPHVNTYINDNTHYPDDIEVPDLVAEKPYNTLIVTGADQGIDNKFVKLSDYNTKIDLFGKGNFQKYGQSSIQADVLLNNGQTNVWYMRVLPDDATYANAVVMAHYKVPNMDRLNPTLDNEIYSLADGGRAMVATGLKQLEIKYSLVNCKSGMLNGLDVRFDTDLDEFVFGTKADGTYTLARGPVYTAAEAQLYGFESEQDLDGWHSVPLFIVRSIGRGKYGNKYAIRLQRDIEFEYDYGIKSYGFGLIERGVVTKAKNYFVGTMVPTTRYETSMLIDDVLGAFPVGSCPIVIKTFNDSFEAIFEAYTEIVKYNDETLEEAGAASKLYREWEDDNNYALNMVSDARNIDSFDPIFGYRLNSTEHLIPYYKNYTAKSTVPYVEPSVKFANYLPNKFDSNLWPSAIDYSEILQVGDRVLVQHYLGDEVDHGVIGPGHILEETSDLHKIYVVRHIDIERDVDESILSSEITWDEGTWVGWDEPNYTGLNLTNDVGTDLAGGSDGEFDLIWAHPFNLVKGSKEPVAGTIIKRQPTPTEMKLLLSREYVKALKGMKDRYILSPARINLDYIFDANYNVCADPEMSKLIEGDIHTRALYANSFVLTNEEYKQLEIMEKQEDLGVYNFGGAATFRSGINSIADALNVKKALYDLNNYRNKNGIVLSREEGAGCELKLDCMLVGLKDTSEVNSELKQIIKIMSQFEGRNTTIDFGFYEIIDPVSKRRIPVTTGYFLAEKLIPHIIRFGPNKPFVNVYAQISTIVRNSFKPELDLIDWDVKELLYLNRINYYLTLDEGLIVQRACQNTCQRDPSALLEESNVRVLNILKKGLERACRSYVYEWNDPVVRKGYTDTQMEIYRPWIGTWVESLTIRFDANEYEQERMIMHCYVDVKFRDIIKRITIEIDISRPNKGGGN